MEPGLWSLDHGALAVEPGLSCEAWVLEPWLWSLDCGALVVDLGFWNLGC